MVPERTLGRPNIFNRPISRRKAIFTAGEMALGLTLAACVGTEQPLKEEPTAISTSEKIPPTQEQKATATVEKNPEFSILWGRGIKSGDWSAYCTSGCVFPASRRLPSFIATDDAVYTNAQEGLVTKFDLKTNQRKWQLEFRGTVFGQFGNVVAVARHGQGVVNDYGSQRIYGIDAETGAELWKYKTTANIWNPPIVVGDSIYFLDQAGYPYRSFAVGELDGVTGNVSIKFTEGKDGVYPSYGDFVDIVGNRIVLMETASPRLVTVLDKDSGNVITTVDVSCTLRPSFSDGLMLLSESKCRWNYSHTQVFDLNTGALLWAKEEGYSIGIGEIKVIGDKFVVKASDGLHGFSLRDGTELWQLPVYDFINEEPMVATQNGILLLKSLRGDSVLGLDTGSGQILWENDEVYSADRIISQDLDAVFLLTESGEMLALDSKTGRGLWKFQSGTKISPVVFGESELIFGSTQVFILDRQTGQKKQQPISISDKIVAIYPKGELTFVEGENTLTVLTKTP